MAINQSANSGTAGGKEHAALIQQVASILAAKGMRLITAESCTGGLVAASLTDIAGSSNWFEGAFVSYRLTAKTRMLGVPQSTLDEHGAVSEPTARAMAEGALHNSAADISVSITGIAGPEGGDVLSPVGTVWFAWGMRTGTSHGQRTETVRCPQTARHQLSGNRTQIRQQAVVIALQGVIDLLS